MDVRGGFGGTGEIECRARDPLIVAKAPERRVGDRGVGKDQLPRRECARTRLRDPWTAAEERDLDTDLAVLSIAKPARDIPPLGAKGGVAAVIARERQRQPRDFRIGDRRSRCTRA